MLLAPYVEELADPLALLLDRVIDMRVGVKRAAENPEVGDLADVRVRDGLENQRLEGAAILGRMLLAFCPWGGIGRHLDDLIHEQIDAAVLGRGAAKNRCQLAGPYRAAEYRDHFLDRSEERR